MRHENLEFYWNYAPNLDFPPKTLLARQHRWVRDWWWESKWSMTELWHGAAINRPTGQRTIKVDWESVKWVSERRITSLMAVTASCFCWPTGGQLLFDDLGYKYSKRTPQVPCIDADSCFFFLVSPSFDVQQLFVFSPLDGSIFGRLPSPKVIWSKFLKRGWTVRDLHRLQRLWFSLQVVDDGSNAADSCAALRVIDFKSTHLE